MKLVYPSVRQHDLKLVFFLRALDVRFASLWRPQPTHFRGVMNILVYSGRGTSQSMIAHTFTTLRKHVGNNYDIQQISSVNILKDPWANSTALLVIPGGRDLPYVEDLSSIGTSYIRKYVENGGNYLGICAGAYFASSRVEFEKNRKEYTVIGDRDLALSISVAKGSIVQDFTYDSEQGAKTLSILNCQDESISDCYVNGSPYFEYRNEIPSNESIIAYYVIPELDSKPLKLPAIIQCKLGSGTAILSGPHIEYDPELAINGSKVLNDSISLRNECRVELIRDVFKRLGLKLNQVKKSEFDLRNTSLYITSLNNELVSNVLDKIKSVSKQVLIVNHNVSNAILLSDDLNTICCMQQDGLLTKSDLQVLDISIDHIINETAPLKVKDSNISLYSCNEPPPITNTFEFNTLNYFKYLNEFSTAPLVFGLPIIYGHVMNSTQTFLSDNYRFKQCLNDGIVCVTTHQTAGKGRGKNSWISKAGCLMFSFLLRHRSTKSVVFIQYLAGIAIVESLKSFHGLKNLAVSIKWPNDIYASINPSEKSSYKKVGGIIVSSSFERGEFTLVIGIGVNISNSTPTVSINDIIKNSLPDADLLSREQVLAKFFVYFDKMYKEFTRNDSFSSFEDLYYRNWLHSYYKVNLEMKLSVLKET